MNLILLRIIAVTDFLLIMGLRATALVETQAVATAHGGEMAYPRRQKKGS